ncbi:helix-turn-helix domain-containing protein [Streptomyces sp. NPDC127051]|uniref:helix-turn-helix domain-containing protein n=1 Tax=Streptomyces sp. NPDC127051 TaxID=3347119 RepID=UPI003663E8C7
MVAALESGRVQSCRQAAEVFGVGERSVGTWWRKYQVGGRDALAVRRTRRSGRPELIGDAERAAVYQAMAGYTPGDLLLAGVTATPRRSRTRP